MPERGIEERGRPGSRPFVDLERRWPHIPRKFIQGWMLAIPGYGTEYGKYGRSRYGRCIYGARIGIYGHDRYGSATYY